MQAWTLGDLSRDLDVPDTQSENSMRAAIRSAGLAGGALGQLEDLGVWLAGVQDQAPPREPRRIRLVVFAGDHGVREAEVSSLDASDSVAAVHALLDGTALSAQLAELDGVGLRVADLSVAGTTRADISVGKVGLGSGRIDQADALSAAEVSAALGRGATIADEEIDGGADLFLLGDVGVASTTTAATMVSVLTATEPVRVVGRGRGIDDATWMRKVTAIRDARLRAMPRRHDLDDLLAAIGSADLAAMTGFIMRAAARRTPVILDGVVTGAAALIAREFDPRIQRWLQAAVLTGEPAHAIALERLRLDPIITRGVEAGGGAGAVLAVPMVRAAARAMAGLPVGTEPEPATESESSAEPDPRPDPDPTPDPTSVSGATHEENPVLEPESGSDLILEPDSELDAERGTDVDDGDSMALRHREDDAAASDRPPRQSDAAQAPGRTAAPPPGPRPRPATKASRRIAGGRRRTPPAN